MFENHSCNLKPIDSMIRFLLATLILIYAVYNCYLILIPISILLYYTALTKFCFAYYFFKINQRLSTKNYYLSFLPKYNPSSVFIFNAKGDILFKNEAAKAQLPKVVSPKCLGITHADEIIEDSILDTIFTEKENIHYQVEIQGIKFENILLAYLTDITEIIELNNEIEDTQREVIYAMGEIGETRSKETGHHVKRVALYSKKLALLYGLPSEEAEKLHMASPMHDIGKVGIPDDILNAPRKLDLEEWKVMQTHAELGYEMLKNSKKPILQAAAIVAREHHEKWDGSGYPNAKAGEDIHIYGRITALADVFDALGSERVYKKAWELDEILELFREESAKHFDPKLVKLFLDNLNDFLLIRDKFKDI